MRFSAWCGQKKGVEDGRQLTTRGCPCAPLACPLGGRSRLPGALAWACFGAKLFLPGLALLPGGSADQWTSEGTLGIEIPSTVFDLSCYLHSPHVICTINARRTESLQKDAFDQDMLTRSFEQQISRIYPHFQAMLKWHLYDKCRCNA